MIEPKDVVIDGKSFVISKFPAVAGREIITQYPLSAVPKLGDYATNEDLMLKMMHYVGIRTNQIMWLKTRELVDNHVPNFEILMKLEYALMEYNCSFLQDGKISNFLEGIVEKLPSWIIKISTPLLAELSQKEKPPSKNSKKSTL